MKSVVSLAKKKKKRKKREKGERRGKEGMLLYRQGSIRGGRPQEVAHLKDMTLSQLKPEREGYLVKQGQKVKSWKKRYFVLQGQTLYYFANKKPDSKVIGTVALVASSVMPDSLTRKKYAFQVLSRLIINSTLGLLSLLLFYKCFISVLSRFFDFINELSFVIFVFLSVFFQFRIVIIIFT